MEHGFISVACGTPKLRLADCAYNAEQTFQMMRSAEKAGVKVLVLPELGLTGYSCGDLFYQEALLREAEEGLKTVLAATRNLEVVTALGLPLRIKNKLYNSAAIIQKGKILGLVPKTHLPNYGEFYEKRWFATAPAEPVVVNLCGQDSLIFQAGQIFECENIPGLTLGFEICEDLWSPDSPSTGMAKAGATIIGNQQRCGGQGRLPPPAGDHAERQAPLRLCLFQRRGGGVHCGFGVRSPPAHRGKRHDAGGAPL